MSKTKRMNSKEQALKERDKGRDEEKAPGYGDKKLEGPNRPAE
ncbi:MAG TPA: hypothetical protein VIG80_02390 [Bacillaceae bacterium]